MKQLAQRIAAGLALCLVVGLAACGGDDTDDAASTSTSATTDETEADGADGAGTTAAVAALEQDPAIAEALAVTDRSTTYVGTVDGADAYIAVVDNGAGAVTVYVCDGSKVGAWAQGERTGDTVTASSASGVQVDATVSGTTVSGSIVVPDWGTHAFTATEAAYPAGLWRPLDAEAGEFAGLKVGWVVLDDGSQRGLALTSQKQLQIVEPVDTVGGAAGSSTAGPVTTGGLSSECQTLQNLWQRGWRTFALNDEGTALAKAGLKLMKQVEGLWDQQGCPGTPISSS
jgi:serine/threonine-protein kinase